MHIYIDEAGRGPLAGPVYVGLVALDSPDKKYFKLFENLGFKDSKKLSSKKRQALFDLLLGDFRGLNRISEDLQQDLSSRISSGTGFVSSSKNSSSKVRSGNGFATLSKGSSSLKLQSIKRTFSSSSAKYIDAKGIVPAIRQAIIKGVRKLIFGNKKFLMSELKKYLLDNKITLHIDGNADFGLSKKLTGLDIKTYIKGDDLLSPISVASVIAKVSRDDYMDSLNIRYKKYGFAKHKGYGTLSHRQAIKKYGLSDIHRKSFCKNLV